MFMKKYFILAATALAALCACTKVHVNEAPEVDQPISFQVAPYSAATKASGSGSNAFLATGNTSFGVFSYFNTVSWTDQTATTPASTDQPYFDAAGEEVTHGNTNDADDWATATTHYWPKVGFLTFVGWAPYSKTPTFTKSAGITWTNYAVVPAPGATNKVDLLYSDVAFDKTKNENLYGHTGVPMLFHHALAKLNFKLKYDMTNLTAAQKALFKIQITSITLKQLGNTATYTDAAWGTPSVKADQQLASTSNLLTSTSATQDDYVENYYVIPQTPATLTVNFTINGVACSQDLILSDSTAIPTWSKGNVYTYTLVISPIEDEVITFDPSADAWPNALEDEIDLS